MSDHDRSTERTPREWYAWLLDPVAPETFERDYYERRLCHVSRRDPDRYAALLTPADLDTVLGSHAARPPDIGLVDGERSIPVADYTNDAGRVQPLEVVRRYDAGATIVFRQLHNRVGSLARACGALGQQLSSRVQANVYLTPPEARGLAPHWDTHDVFVLQVRGRKHWTFYDTKVALPLRGQPFEPDGSPPGDVTDELDLEAGSLVYVPRGRIHAARSAGEPSLHITVGLTAVTWTDLLLESVSAAALEHEALRRTLPPGFARPDFPAETRDRLDAERLGLVRDQGPSERVWQRLAHETRAANAPLFTDLLSQRLDDEPLTLRSVVGRREGLPVEVSVDAEHCRLRFGGREIALPAVAHEAAAYSLARSRFTVGELPDGLDDAGKLVLARRLVREGLLQRR